ncbi:hypothetical protein [Enterococcus rivorum]|uniref:Lipoprotein n=1 Tax=Enterococcus rivorum TaxID=762845 RepID=A0A1E5KUB5_9ENTE|nr:hypothetical protein [Enterococcus rivorum]MBP2098915.1 hypothetical protein [Enterococcus rivorum]OEH81482.1 hypothetical protein BCR26_04355 [Enterococcus rivorum]
MKKSVLLVILVLSALTGCTDGQKEKTMVSSNETSSKQSAEKLNDAEKMETYDEIVKEAKKLNIEGNFKESELKLALIPVSVLGNKDYSTLKEAVENLSSSNNKGLQEQNEDKKTEQKANEAATVKAADTSSGFNGDLAKWANTYVFYYLQDGQKQSRLTITGNGGVTQNNYDGTQYFGTASITANSSSALSYNTDTMYPSRMPATKSINSNVKISIQWDNGGGSQVYYGYLSNSSRLILTDGISQNNGVHEVWVTY